MKNYSYLFILFSSFWNNEYRFILLYHKALRNFFFPLSTYSIFYSLKQRFASKIWKVQYYAIQTQVFERIDCSIRLPRFPPDASIFRWCIRSEHQRESVRSSKTLQRKAGVGGWKTRVIYTVHCAQETKGKGKEGEEHIRSSSGISIIRGI